MSKRALIILSATVATLIVAVLVAVMMWPVAPQTTPAKADKSKIPLSEIDGSTTPSSFVLDIDVKGATTAKLVVDGNYVGKVEKSPLEFKVNLDAGSHRLRVQTNVGEKDEARVEAEFTVSEAKQTPKPSATQPPSNSAPVTGNGEVIAVSTPDELRAALANAAPGDTIDVADGEYEFKPRLVATASGTAEQPITLRGSRAAVLRTKNASGDYGLHITGDYWRVEGLTVAHATKGIVLDGSVGTVIDNVEVYDIGDEAVHFRTCSSDGVLRNSFIHDTGRNSAQYGEGVYVGSANSNWSKYECTDATEGQTEGDNTERVLIENNVFEDITAEGADLKEGTDSGTLRNNEFRRAGLSGQNSADSAVDAKGNNWVIEGNTVSETDAPWDDDGVSKPSEFADGFQAHSVYNGYGTGNIFRGNTVEGKIPGFGVGLYPADGNIVTCDNVAKGAALGLVGNKSRKAKCGKGEQ